MTEKNAALETLRTEVARLRRLRSEIDEQIKRLSETISYYEDGTSKSVETVAARPRVRVQEEEIEPLMPDEPPEGPVRPQGREPYIFTPERANFIRRNFLRMNNEELRVAANRLPGDQPIQSSSSISQFLQRAGLTRGKQITEQRYKFICENYLTMSNRELRMACNKMPGRRIPTDTTISNTLWKAGLSRRPDAPPDDAVYEPPPAEPPREAKPPEPTVESVFSNG